MTLVINTESTPVIVTLPVRLDGANAPEAESDLAPVLTMAKSTVIDASGCEYISSAGLRLLLIMAKRLKPSGCAVLVAGMSQDLMDIMRMTGFDHLFVFLPTVEDAIAAGG